MAGATARGRVFPAYVRWMAMVECRGLRGGGAEGVERQASMHRGRGLEGGHRASGCNWNQHPVPSMRFVRLFFSSSSLSARLVTRRCGWTYEREKGADEKRWDIEGEAEERSRKLQASVACFCRSLFFFIQFRPRRLELSHKPVSFHGDTLTWPSEGTAEVNRYTTRTAERRTSASTVYGAGAGHGKRLGLGFVWETRRNVDWLRVVGPRGMVFPRLRRKNSRWTNGRMGNSNPTQRE